MALEKTSQNNKNIFSYKQLIFVDKPFKKSCFRASEKIGEVIKVFTGTLLTHLKNLRLVIIREAVSAHSNQTSLHASEIYNPIIIQSL